MKRDDEFYTRYEDIQTELNHYTKEFENKTILCNCDDPYESNFCLFFLRNFNFLRLKRLICTSFSGSPVIGTQLSLFDEDDQIVVNTHGYVLDVSSVPMSNGRGVSDADINALLKSKRLKKLKGNGDFRSRECMKYLHEADIVVTNPPFSCFIQYIGTLVENRKKFLIIGRETAVSYKEVFPLLKDNIIWIGYSHAKEFYRPDGTIAKFGNVMWFTNMEVSKRKEGVILYRRYDPDEYFHYDNYDGIDVPTVNDIPSDYMGAMGVPVSFLWQHNPEQFEIIGYGKGELAKSIGVTRNYRGRCDVAITLPDGTHKCPFSRIIIRRKQS